MPALLSPGESELREVPADAAAGVCGGLCSHLLREVSEVVTHTIGDHHLSPPNICLLLVGRHPAALSYARSTVAAASAAGVTLRVQELPETAAHAQVAGLLNLYNTDPTCHGAHTHSKLPCLSAARRAREDAPKSLARPRPLPGLSPPASCPAARPCPLPAASPPHPLAPFHHHPVALPPLLPWQA